MTTPSVARRHDVDWLRIFATFMLFLFHGAMVFNPAPFYHVRNADLSIVMMIFAGFVSLWHMPLFFVLAGWSIHESFGRRGAAGFLRARWRRLFVPLLIGCVTLGPIIKYLELRSGLDMGFSGLKVAPQLQDSFRSVIPSGLDVAPPFNETFLEFLPTFFTQLDRFTWSHLWFVAYLFTFSVLYCGVFARLVRGRPRFEHMSEVWVYAPIALLALVQVMLRPHWPGIQNLVDDWANFAYYSTFLFLGFMMAREPAYEAAVHREWRRALGVALLAVLALLAAVLGVYSSEPVILALTAVAGWCSIVFALGAAHRYLNRTGPVHRYLRESAFPVYILHQPALVVIGYVVVGLSLGIAAKFVLLVSLAIAATLAFYHLVVRYVPVLRLAYGMKPLSDDGRGSGLDTESVGGCEAATSSSRGAGSPAHAA